MSGPAPAVELRIATAKDIDAITEITREAYAKWAKVIGREPLPMQANYAALINVHRFDLLIVGGTLVGLIETIPLDRYLLIENVAVRPSFQGRGHGRQLLAHAEQLAAATGLAGTRLCTNARFAENIRLYRSLGYRVEREETMNDATAVHMIKERNEGGLRPG